MPQVTDTTTPDVEEPAIVRSVRRLVEFDSDEHPDDQCIRCRCGMHVEFGDEPTDLCHDCAHHVFSELGVVFSHIDHLTRSLAKAKEALAQSQDYIRFTDQRCADATLLLEAEREKVARILARVDKAGDDDSVSAAEFAELCINAIDELRQPAKPTDQPTSSPPTPPPSRPRES